MTDSVDSNGATTRALILCEKSGNMARPWAEAGHVAICVDLENDERTEHVGDGRIEYVQADIREYQPPDGQYVFGAGHPPCTDLAVSGAKHFRDKGLRALAHAIENVAVCRDILADLDCPWMVENPKSTLSTYWRSPDYRFDPFQYSGYTDRDEAYTKDTWLWTGGGFRMPLPDSDVDRDEADDRIHKMPPGEERSSKRSETPTGFARAVFLAHEDPEQYARADSGTLQASLQEVA